MALILPPLCFLYYHVYLVFFLLFFKVLPGTIQVLFTGSTSTMSWGGGALTERSGDLPYAQVSVTSQIGRFEVTYYIYRTGVGAKSSNFENRGGGEGSYYRP